jgi:hypothetical protein
MPYVGNTYGSTRVQAVSKQSVRRSDLGPGGPFGPRTGPKPIFFSVRNPTSYASEISRFTYLEIYETPVFLSHTLQKTGENRRKKKTQDSISSFRRVTSQIKFAKLNSSFFSRFLFLYVIFFSSYTYRNSLVFLSTKILSFISQYTLSLSI